MSGFNKIEDIDSWVLARSLFQDNIELFTLLKESNEFALRNQMIRSCGSVMDNIAEGFGRNGNREFIQFLTIAKGSLNEFKSQLYRCLDMQLIPMESHHLNVEKIDILNAKIGKLISYLRKSDFKGTKFK